MTEWGAEGRPELADAAPDLKGSYPFQTFHAPRTLDVIDRSPALSGAIYWTLREFEIYPGWTGRRRPAAAAVRAEHAPPQGPDHVRRRAQAGLRAAARPLPRHTALPLKEGTPAADLQGAWPAA